MEWKTAWITGASSGIGLELAKRLDGDVAHVAISARSEKKLISSAKAGRTLTPYPLDVSNATAVASAVKQIESNAGPIDLAILNAGVWYDMWSHKMQRGKIRSALDVNYMGVVNCIDALLPGMLKRGSGHIAIVASIAGYRGLPRAIAYGPTKAALINLAETMHLELEPHGILVSVVNPGFVDTPMTEDNTFPMPAIIPVEEAATSILEGLQAGKFEIAFPKGFIFWMKALRRAPYPLFFWIMRTFILPKSR